MNKLYFVSYKRGHNPTNYSNTDSLVFASSPERAIELTLKQGGWQDSNGLVPDVSTLKAVEAGAGKERVIWSTYKDA